MTREHAVIEPRKFHLAPRAQAAPPSPMARRTSESSAGAMKPRRFAWRIYLASVLYASTVASEIADTTADIDLGMRLGYS